METFCYIELLYLTDFTYTYSYGPAKITDCRR